MDPGDSPEARMNLVLSDNLQRKHQLLDNPGACLTFQLSPVHDRPQSRPKLPSGRELTREQTAHPASYLPSVMVTFRFDVVSLFIHNFNLLMQLPAQVLGAKHNRRVVSAALPCSQGAHSTLAPEEYLELAQGKPAGAQWCDSLSQVSFLLRLLVHDLLIPLLLRFCQHQTLRAQV